MGAGKGSRGMRRDCPTASVRGFYTWWFRVLCCSLREGESSSQAAADPPPFWMGRANRAAQRWCHGGRRSSDDIRRLNVPRQRRPQRAARLLASCQCHLSDLANTLDSDCQDCLKSIEYSFARRRLPQIYGVDALCPPDKGLNNGKRYGSIATPVEGPAPRALSASIDGRPCLEARRNRRVSPAACATLNVASPQLLIGLICRDQLGPCFTHLRAIKSCNYQSKQHSKGKHTALILKSTSGTQLVPTKFVTLKMDPMADNL